MFKKRKTNYDSISSISISDNRWLNYTIIMIMSLLSVVIFVILSCDARRANSIYEHMWVLPISYALINVLFIKVFKRVTPVILVITIMYFIKTCIAPLMTCIEGYPVDLYHCQYSEYYTIITPVLMVYEMLIVYIVMYCQKNVSTGVYNAEKIYEHKSNFPYANIITMTIIFISIVLCLVYPAFIKQYRFVFSSFNSMMSETASEMLLKTVPDGLRWIGSQVIEASKLILIQILLNRLFSKYKLKKRRTYLLMSISLVVLNSLFVSQRLMYNFIVLAAQVIYICTLYKEKRERIYAIIGVIFVPMVILAAFVYLNYIMSWHSISVLLQMYAGGYYMQYQSLMALDAINISIIQRAEMFVVGENLQSGDVIRRILNLAMQNTQGIVDAYMNYGKAQTGTITPMLATARFYFTGVLSPIFSAISVAIACKRESRVFRKGNSIVNLMIVILLSLAPMMYTYSSVIRYMLVVFLPYYLISGANKIRIK